MKHTSQSMVNINNSERLIRLLLADDHGIVRKGIRSLLDDDQEFEVISDEAANGERALHLAVKHHPDIILLDLQMPGTNGIEVCQRIAESSPQTIICVLTAYFNRCLVEGCLRAGARAYLLKDAETLNLKEQLKSAVEGHIVLDPRVTDIVTDYLLKHKPSPEILNEQELVIINLVGKGFTNKEIGVKLYISDNTVKSHIKIILTKLGARNRIEAVNKAKEQGLI